MWSDGTSSSIEIWKFVDRFGKTIRLGGILLTCAPIITGIAFTLVVPLQDYTHFWDNERVWCLNSPSYFRIFIFG